MKIDRNSLQDAKKVIESFIPNGNIRKIVLSFLADAIVYANKLNNNNWNLNLDTSAKDIQFNVGGVYSIRIDKEVLLVLCLKKYLPNIIFKNNHKDLLFSSYNGGNGMRSHNFNIVSNYDSLKSIPDSVGIKMFYVHADKYLPRLKASSKKFLEYSIKKTTIRSNMKNAHSTGTIAYLNKYLNRNLDNPQYNLLDNEVSKNELQEKKQIKKLSTQKLENIVKKQVTSYQKREVTRVEYTRNVYLSEYVKRLANGICQDCKQPAPFITKSTQEPYLETHHIIPLAEGGEDSIDNMVALCPNCHRERHYG